MWLKGCISCTLRLPCSTTTSSPGEGYEAGRSCWACLWPEICAQPYLPAHTLLMQQYSLSACCYLYCSNVLLTKDLRACIADLGIAQAVCSHARSIAGCTYSHAAPEQLLGKRCTQAADMYRCGLLVCTEDCLPALPLAHLDVSLPDHSAALCLGPGS